MGNAPGSELYYAAKFGNLADVRSLLQSGYGPNDYVNENGRTALYRAAMSGYTEIVYLLLSRGAYIDQVDNKGGSPIYIAAKNNHVDVVRLLIRSGCNVNITNNEGETPIYAAVDAGFSGNKDIVDLLLQANADFNIENNAGFSALTRAKYFFHDNFVQLFTLAEEMNPQLVDAAKSGKADQLVWLLSNYVNPNATDTDGNTLLHLAILNNKPEVLRKLCKHDSILLNRCNQDGITPFVLAMQARNAELIKIMQKALNKPAETIAPEDLLINSNAPLGRGTYGDVYTGYYNSETVAVKTFYKKTEGFAEMLEREINTMKLCYSPFVLHLIGVCQVDSPDVKLVVEYMDGGDLQSHLTKLRNNEPTITNYSKLELAWAIAKGLADVHQLGFLHRDLKSQNILLSSTKYIKLADLGLTRDIVSTMTSAAGTLWWTAPEVLEEEGYYAFAADIYSFGVVLTELDTLQLPYYDSKMAQLSIINEVRAGTMRPSLSDTCEPWYKNLVDKCLAHDPSQRPTAVEVALIISAQFETKAKLSFSEIAVTQMSRMKQLALNARMNSKRAPPPAPVSRSLPAPKVITKLRNSEICCPSQTCKEVNSLLNESCTKCNLPLLKTSTKINILLARLKEAKLHCNCPVCHFENEATAKACSTCDVEIPDESRLHQLVELANTYDRPTEVPP